MSQMMESKTKDLRESLNNILGSSSHKVMSPKIHSKGYSNAIHIAEPPSFIIEAPVLKDLEFVDDSGLFYNDKTKITPKSGYRSSRKGKNNSSYNFHK